MRAGRSDIAWKRNPLRNFISLTKKFRLKELFSIFSLQCYGKQAYVSEKQQRSVGTSTAVLLLETLKEDFFARSQRTSSALVRHGCQGSID